MSNLFSKSKFAFHYHCCLCIWDILNLLPFRSSILEPNFHLYNKHKKCSLNTHILLSFGLKLKYTCWLYCLTHLLLSDIKAWCHLRSLRRGQVLLAFKTFFQFEYLLPCKGRSHLFPPICLLPTHTILVVRIFASLVSLSSMEFMWSYNFITYAY